MTEDFHLAVYISGDKNSNAVYSTRRLIIEYKHEGPQPPTEPGYDLTLAATAGRFFLKGESSVRVTVENSEPDDLLDTATIAVTSESNPSNNVATDRSNIKNS